MGLVERWLGGAPRQRMTSDELARILRLGSGSKAGASVTVETAIRVSTVYACVRRIADGIARLPFRVHQVDARGVRRVAKEHPLFAVLNRKPNARMTSFEWRQTSMFHVLLAKGAHSYINRVRGEVRELTPIHPGAIVAKCDRTGAVSHYEVALKDGSRKEVPAQQIMRVPGPSWDGVEALDMLSVAREAIGLSIATEESMATLHKSGIRPSGILTTDGTLQKTTVDRVQEMIKDDHTGSSKQFGMLVLDAGLKFQSIAMNANDAQAIQTREFQVAEVARMFQISPMMIGHPDKTSTFASAEAFLQDFIDNTLGPWVEEWEQAVTRDLLTEEDLEQGFYVKLDTRALLRGDPKSRAEYYKSGILTGWMTRNEAREKEDLNPIEGLDEPLAPVNMLPAKDLGKDRVEEPPPGEPGDPGAGEDPPK